MVILLYVKSFWHCKVIIVKSSGKSFIHFSEVIWLFIKWIVTVAVGVIMFFINGWLTGNNKYGITSKKDDERSQLIKHKTIVSSWLLLMIFFIINFIFNFFNLDNDRLAMVEFNYPELFYLLIAIVSYFIYYWIYSRKMSSYEKKIWTPKRKKTYIRDFSKKM